MADNNQINKAKKGYLEKFSFKIILLFVCLAILGLAFLPLLPVKLSPSQNLPQVNVSFNMSGASPIVVEMEVTSKLEAMLNRMSGVQKISSLSRNGGGRITIELDRHTDMDIARFEAAAIIRQIWSQLPDNVSYPSVSLSRSDDNSLRPFLSYTLIAPQRPIEIQQFAEEVIKPVLSSVKGIYQVNVSGATPMEWQLEYDYIQLEILGISTADIQSALNSLLRTEPLGMASIQKNRGENRRIRVAYSAEQQGIDENMLRALEITKVNERIVYLDDIVSIRRVESQPSSYFRINGLNTIYLSLIADEQANQLELGNRIKRMVEEIQADLPEGYSIQLAYDATEYITAELNKIYFRAGLTVLILLLFVVIVYRNLKYILLVASSLAINIAVAFIFYYLLGLEMQLYSLAGITISLTLIIDNTIVMSDQIIYRGNKKAFLAILAATLTTIGALSVIFFLDESIRLNLKDFAAVIIINLSVSLLTALFLVPALIEKMRIEKKRKKQGKKRWLTYFNRIYTAMTVFIWRWKVVFVILIILAFGLPVYLLPDKIESESRFAETYNNTIGSTVYKEKIRPHVNNFLGGTLHLFSQKVHHGSLRGGRQGETMLHVTASLPHGSTLEQMNTLVQRMEAYIGQFSQVRQFETHIMSANRASINIRFTREAQRGGFPFQLKSDIIGKALELGGGSWSVHGLGDSFNNSVREMAGSYRVVMFGFNYDELYVHAENFREKLLENRRIREVEIKSEFSWFKDDFQEFRFDLKKDRLAQANIQPFQLYAAIRPFFERRIPAGSIRYQSNYERLILKAKQSTEYTLWDLMHIPLQIGDRTVKLSDLAVIEKYQAPQNIAKENQQYRLSIQYNYVGSHEQGRRIMQRNIEETRQELPVGYTIEAADQSWMPWGKTDSKQYWLLALVFVIIYFCSSILFNSFKQPLYVIFIIPISFIGLFLTFYLFKLTFDQGGFAAFILLAGVTVNMNIYIINEYNNIVKYRKIPPMRAYLKAWNAKARPIFLTIISTMLGFIPFLVGYKEGFWFPLAAGTIGGLFVASIGTFLFLPLFMGVGKRKKLK